jgi:putative membrane protein
MVIQAGEQKTAIALFDSNNMELGFRETILKELNDLPIDELEVLTTDTHSVNTLANGYNPIGVSEKSKIIEYLRESILTALEDLEPVEAGTDINKIKNLKTFGPNNSTELISTISSIVAVSKIMAPLIFITALIFVFIWIYFL